MNRKPMTLAEMAERAIAMNGQAGVACPKCNCRDFRTYKTIPSVTSVFRYKACRLCGHKILTTSQTNERVIREIQKDDPEAMEPAKAKEEQLQLSLELPEDNEDVFENDVF